MTTNEAYDFLATTGINPYPERQAEAEFQRAIAALAFLAGQKERSIAVYDVWGSLGNWRFGLWADRPRGPRWLFRKRYVEYAAILTRLDMMERACIWGQTFGP